MAADIHFTIKSDSPVNGELMFWSVVGHEGLSRPSAYELAVLSKNQQIDAKDILGRAFDVVIEFEDADGGKHERHCQGHAVRFMRTAQVGRLFEYRIHLRSWFWLLTKRRNSWIQQDKKVLDVFDAVCEDSPVKRFKKHKSGNVIGTHNPHRYCVQYEESDYAFLSRLLEEEGIYYWFDAHDAPGTMHLADSSDVAHEKLPAGATLRWVDDAAGEGRFNEITRWIGARRFDSGKHAARDSDFKAIQKKLGADVDASDTHELGNLEVFEFPGDYFNPDDAENIAKIRGEELVARRERQWALTTWPDVAAGRSFTYEGDPDGQRDGDYVIGTCTFVVTHPGYESVDFRERPRQASQLLEEALAEDAVNAGTLDVLRELLDETPHMRTGEPGICAFVLTVFPVELPFKPPRLTPRVAMPGPQSAIVVGPQGEELHVDEHGRVKVHFHWDRSEKRNEKSTCWVRVSQPWAGKGWGGYFIPRIGQEVLVDFLNGDPDRPIIVGRLYNDDQPIPYKSPTQSGFKTRSTPGGNPGTCNEIMFEDKKGEEKISIHAELDMSRSVERDDSTSIDRDQTVTVKRDQTSLVDRDRKHTVTRNDTNMVVVDQKNTVKGNQNNQVVGNQTSFVDANHQLTVGGTSTVDVVGARKTTYKAGETHTVVGNQTVSVTGLMSFKAGSMKFETPHIDWMVTGSSSKNITVPTGPLNLMANKIKLMSNTGIEMMSVGNIDQTAIGSNTTILGPNTSGYIGTNSEANLGINRSTFMGMSIENALALAMSNNGGVFIENTLGVKLVNCVAPEIKSISTADVNLTPLKTISPGGGGGPATGAAVAGALGAVAGAGSAFSDIGATLKQYADAAQALNDAADEAQAEGMNGLASRLRSLAVMTNMRRNHGILGAVPVVGTGLQVFLEVFTGGDAIGAGQLASDGATTNADGSAIPSPSPPSTGGGSGGSGGGGGTGGGGGAGGGGGS
ncbi:type VI secretion system Vgr family protein [Variovorax sp. JS1663]|uniref:type VI secretion system Vgr family protein n=1 Tax=Variovorax sp. JS1663 TaxID=1851577 RepID=UPI000B347002|nr:type VI secretion system tip protein TssI/VgrG [Variovorax sp. JS1663]OUL99143.1 type VI secretion protein Vgr [Variovorax sp. JS1663]